MSDVEVAEAELPLDSAGNILVRAREAAGMTRAQVAAQTRIPERHLIAIENGDYAALPARTYAIGFSRSYAKVVGASEADVVAAVRSDLNTAEPEPQRRHLQTFEPGDPARVPSSRFAWLAALAALLVILAGFALWRSYYAPGGNLPSLLPEESPSPAAAPAAPVTASAPAPSGPVVFTAQQQGVWVKFTDGNGAQLLQKQLAMGESFTVPADQGEVKLWTARPDQLAITIGGQAVPRLSDVQQTMKDVPVTAAALLARAAPPPAGLTPTAAAVAPAPRPRQQRTTPRPTATAPAAQASPLSAPSDAVPAAAAPAVPNPAAT